MTAAPGKLKLVDQESPQKDISAEHATSSSGGGRNPRDTPAMRQYARFKQQHPECVLFFRMGDFYEMFDDDALLCHKVLGITLTQRTQGIPMAGVPYHAVESYLRRMIEAGYRVAVCEQVQDPKDAVGVVDRSVTRVVTPGTLVDESLLNEAQANTVAAIVFNEPGLKSSAVIALAELSTGAFTLMEMHGDRVIDELVRINPSELLYVETADGAVPPRVDAIRSAVGCALTPRPAWTFRQSDARDTLREHFGVMNLSGFGLAEDETAIAPAGALLRYLQETQPHKEPSKRHNVESSTQASGPGVDDVDVSTFGRFDVLCHLRPPRKQSTDEFVLIDASSLRSLEIERTMRTGDYGGSLLSVLQRCRTSMGKRLLRDWLCFPLRKIDAITVRQRCVGDLLQDNTFAESLAQQIEGVQDVARIVGRISMRRATPRDLVALGMSTVRISAIAELLNHRHALEFHHARLAQLVASLSPLAVSITKRCNDDPPSHMREGGLFRDNIDSELDEARTLQRDANSWLAAYQKQLIDETSINSLKVGYNQVFGYYIEITHAKAERVPDTFTRKQTLKNAERYITPELKEFEDKVTTAEARAVEREKLLFEKLCVQASRLAGSLSEFANIVAELDVLLNFAEIARRFNYVKPELVDEPVLDIRQGRHPVLDRTLGERFVPNDCVLGESDETTKRRSDGGEPADEGSLSNPSSHRRSIATSLALITGPNMAGKSTFIRQVALIVLLAHTGSYVPAQAATIGAVDRIFTRIGSADELHTGQSTFMVEMTETANILHHATDRSLVILDEIGRGTSTLDGLSLAWAIAESLAVSRPRTLFATHYHELTSLADRLPNVTNLHVAVREWGEQIIFLYRILPGRTDRSYGIHVAKIAGLPHSTIQRASELLETLAVQTEHTQIPAEFKPASPAKGAQLGLFTEYLDHPVVDELRQLDLDAMTPMQAFDALRKLKESLR
jgi:DNA mismatch repair protein MutS